MKTKVFKNREQFMAAFNNKNNMSGAVIFFEDQQDMVIIVGDKNFAELNKHVYDAFIKNVLDDTVTLEKAKELQIILDDLNSLHKLNSDELLDSVKYSTVLFGVNIMMCNDLKTFMKAVDTASREVVSNMSKFKHNEFTVRALIK